jgi:hypothetical protein
MPCNLDLFARLDPGFTPAGTWVPGYQVGGNCDTIQNDNPAGTGYFNAQTGEFFVDNAPVGTYHFTYRVGEVPCRDCATITIFVAAKPVFVPVSTYCGPGTTTTYLCEKTICTTETAPINIYTTFFNNTPTTNPGIVLTSADAGFTTTGDITNHTFNPAAVGTGTFSVKYYRQVADGNDCVDCRTTMEVKITKIAQGVAGSDKSITVCRV